MVHSRFYQLYVIRAPLDDTSVSCVYALLTGKSYAAYRKLLEIVIEKCTSLSGTDPYPSKIVIDFEAAMIRAVTDVFGYNGLVHNTWHQNLYSPFHETFAPVGEGRQQRRGPGGRQKRGGTAHILAL